MILACLMLLLSGCTTTPDEPAKIIVREPILPPSAYVQPCYAQRPESGLLGDVIESLRAANLQCNAQLSSLREWAKKPMTDEEDTIKNDNYSQQK